MSETPESNERDMAPTPVNIALLRYQADNIPAFDGNPKQLNRFIKSCENFIVAFQNLADPNDPINTCLFDTILSKLRDRAADLIGSRTELNTWQLIKDSLNLTFSDQRSIDCLIQDLISLKPSKNETPTQFGMRIQDARSLLFSKLNAGIQNVQEKTIKIQHYDDFALKTFINGLPYNMQLVVRLRNPDNLEKALAYVIEEENFIYLKNGQNNNLQNTSYRPQFNVNQNFQKPIANYPKFQQPQQIPNINPFRAPLPNFQNQFNNKPFFRPQQPPYTRPQGQFPQTSQNNFTPFRNNFRPPFYNNTRPNWQPNNRFPTQQHPQFANQRTSAVLRNQAHNFQQQNQNRGEPMDTSSGNLKSNSNPKQNIISQELFAQQVQNYTQPPNTNTNHETQNFDTSATLSENNYPHYYENMENFDDHTNLYPLEYDTNAEYSYEPPMSQNETSYEEDGNFRHAPDQTNLT